MENKEIIKKVHNRLVEAAFKDEVESLLKEHGVVKTLETMKNICEDAKKTETDKNKIGIWGDVCRELKDVTTKIKIDRAHQVKFSSTDIKI